MYWAFINTERGIYKYERGYLFLSQRCCQALAQALVSLEERTRLERGGRVS